MNLYNMLFMALNIAMIYCVLDVSAMQRANKLLGRAEKSFMKRQGVFINVSSSEGAHETIAVPLNILRHSTIINSMIEDLEGATVVAASHIVIPLSASLEIIKDIFHTLTFPDSLQEKLKNYSLQELIDRYNFLHHYEFSGNITKLFEEKLASYKITNDQESEQAELFNRDAKKIVFIDPAIGGLKRSIIKKHINDKDRSTVLFSGNSIEFDYPEQLENKQKSHLRGSDLLAFISSCAFSPDGKKMVSGGCSGSGQESLANLLLWAVRDDGSINPVPQSFSGNLKLPTIYSVNFSPDGKKVVSGGPCNEAGDNLFLWTFNDDGSINSTPQVLKGHGEDVYGLAFHPIYKNIMISAGKGVSSLLLWTFNDDGSINSTPQVLKDSSEGDITQVAISADGKIMISSGSSGIRLWTFNDDGSINTEPIPLKIKDSFLELGNKFTNFVNIALSPNGKKMVAGIGENLVLWSLEDINNIASGEVIQSFPRFLALLFAFSRDNKTLVINGLEGESNQMVLCDITNAKVLQTINCPRRGLFVTFSPNDKKIIAGFMGRLICWNLFTPQEQKMLDTLPQNLNVVKAQLISMLSNAMQEGKKVELSDFDANVYKGLPVEVQKLFEDTVLIATAPIKPITKPEAQKRQSTSEEKQLLQQLTDEELRSFNGDFSQLKDIIQARKNKEAAEHRRAMLEKAKADLAEILANQDFKMRKAFLMKKNLQKLLQH